MVKTTLAMVRLCSGNVSGRGASPPVSGTLTTVRPKAAGELELQGGLAPRPLTKRSWRPLSKAIPRSKAPLAIPTESTSSVHCENWEGLGVA